MGLNLFIARSAFALGLGGPITHCQRMNLRRGPVTHQRHALGGPKTSPTIRIDRSCAFCGKATISLEGRNKLRNEDLTGRMVRACSSDGKLKERVVNKQSLASI